MSEALSDQGLGDGLLGSGEDRGTGGVPGCLHRPG